MDGGMPDPSTLDVGDDDVVGRFIQDVPAAAKVALAPECCSREGTNRTIGVANSASCLNI